MHEYIEILNVYLAEHEQDYRCSSAQTLVDKLCCCHQQQKGVDTDAVTAQFGALDRVLSSLPLREQDQVIDLTTKLCAEHQKDAFRDGLLVGFRLYTELHSYDADH